MLAVYHHICGKREVRFPGEDRQPCAACDKIRDATIKAARYRFGATPLKAPDHAG